MWEHRLPPRHNERHKVIATILEALHDVIVLPYVFLYRFVRSRESWL